MTKITESGYAFTTLQAFPVGATDENHFHPGMTLRDYFAAKALQGWVANPHEAFRTLREHTAKACYALADEMLKAREL